MDAHVNFGYSTVATAPSPASSGTSLVVAAGEGADFPTPPFNAIVWPAGANPRKSTSEVVRVTAISTDTFTITRAQETSSARTIVVGDQIADAVTAKSLTDIEGNVDSVAPVTQAFGDAAASGSSAIFARRDHVHGMPASPGAKLYDYTVSGSDKTSIDTNVDGTTSSLGGYEVLEIFIIARTDESVVRSNVDLFLNNDTGSDYDFQETRGLGSGTASAGSVAGKASFEAPGASATANYAAVIRATIPAYRDTTFYKTVEMTEGYQQATTAACFTAMFTYTLRSTSAISRVAIQPETAAKKLKIGSRLIIYGR